MSAEGSRTKDMLIYVPDKPDSSVVEEDHIRELLIQMGHPPSISERITGFRGGDIKFLYNIPPQVVTDMLSDSLVNNESDLDRKFLIIGAVWFGSTKDVVYDPEDEQDEELTFESDNGAGYILDTSSNLFYEDIETVRWIKGIDQNIRTEIIREEQVPLPISGSLIRRYEHVSELGALDGTLTQIVIRKPDFKRRNSRAELSRTIYDSSITPSNNGHLPVSVNGGPYTTLMVLNYAISSGEIDTQEVVPVNIEYN